ncbi:HAMP domain-containing sensor histidine kinase [Pikeienuella sp. HZG-20]|uniref:HAMP domain-containing sensor histidine kinase n=1 Tax=Paludibacillus litoralis TaxID=3133267 RepID=UPI0030EEE80A
MRRGRLFSGAILSGAPLRAIALSLITFLVVMVVAGAVLVEIMRVSMVNDLRAQIREEAILFGEIYRNEGPEALAEVVRTLSRTHAHGSGVVGLFGANGAPLAGDLSLAPDFIGFGTLTRRIAGGGAGPFDVEVVDLSAHKLVVGRNMTSADALRATLIKALVLVGGVVTVVSLMIGFAVSRDVFGKLQRMSSVLEQVSRGDGDARLPTGGGRDQIDRVSVLMNAHLDRLSGLMEATRNSIVAIAHDLRTPLNRAFLLVQKAGSAGEDEAARAAALARAEREIESIGETFDTILRIARISSSRSRADFEPVPAADLIREIAETYQPVLEDAGQTLTAAPPRDAGPEPRIFGDRRMIGQMLVNLVENASRHTPAGTEVTLSAGVVDGATVIEVADDGPGIPADMRDAAMKPFGRLDDLHDLGGAGLGLALVRAIAERHGARLTLSDNAPGLRVSVRFPAEGAGAPGPSRARNLSEM